MRLILHPAELPSGAAPGPVLVSAGCAIAARTGTAACALGSHSLAESSGMQLVLMHQEYPALLSTSLDAGFGQLLVRGEGMWLEKPGRSH